MCVKTCRIEDSLQLALCTPLIHHKSPGLVLPFCFFFPVAVYFFSCGVAVINFARLHHFFSPPPPSLSVCTRGVRLFFSLCSLEALSVAAVSGLGDFLCCCSSAGSNSLFPPCRALFFISSLLLLFCYYLLCAVVFLSPIASSSSTHLSCNLKRATLRIEAIPSCRKRSW